jgi:hypothetical protein
VFRFVQWEIAGLLGPRDGRYVVRSHAGMAAEHVVVIAREAADPGRRRGRRARSVAPVQSVSGAPVTRATVIEANASASDTDAEEWLARAAGPEAEATVATALDVLNRAIHGHRIAAADPYVAEVARDGPLVTRIGFGSGEQVAEGDWEQARELPPVSPKRRDRHEAALQPQERLAALLGGRDAVLACEELVLRGRLDFERGREREGILQTHLALEAARVELAAWRLVPGMEDRLADFERRREHVAASAAAALAGGVEPGARTTALAALERLQAALRARSAASGY